MNRVVCCVRNVSKSLINKLPSISFLMKSKPTKPLPTEVQLSQDDVKLLIKCLYLCKSIFPIREFGISSASRLLELVSQTMDAYQAFLFQNNDIDKQVFDLISMEQEGTHLIEPGKGMEKNWDSECDRIVQLLPLDIVIAEMQPRIFIEHKDERGLREESPEPPEEEAEAYSPEKGDEGAEDVSLRSTRKKRGSKAFTDITPKKKRTTSGEKGEKKKKITIHRSGKAKTSPSKEQSHPNMPLMESSSTIQ
jgi:hypothetical protein